MKVISLIALLALVFAANCWVYEGHEMKGDASKAVYDGVKTVLLANIGRLANQAAAQSLKADLEQSKEGKRTLKQIDNATVNQIFSLFSLQDPGCDKNNNGKVEGVELKCLSKIWKNYLPK